MADKDDKTTDDKLKDLERAISQVEKQFGEGSVMRMGENAPHMQIEAISTGALTLDIALGIGGLPRGRVVEIYGQEGSGKTTLGMHDHSRHACAGRGATHGRHRGVH
jgi:recombination protein RecA